MKRNRFLIFILLMLMFSSTLCAEDQEKLNRSFNFKTYLIERNELRTRLIEFSPYCSDLIKDIRVSFGKLIGDSTEQAVVEATTCAMGNGGADIVEVFNFKKDGTPIGLQIDDSGYDSTELYRGQSWTPRLEIQNGRLIRWYVMFDKGNREGIPKAGWKRVITYKWLNTKFVIDKVEDVPPELKH